MEHLQLHRSQLGIGDWPVDVKEFRVAPNLLQVGLAESILQNDIEDGLSDRILIVDEFTIKQGLRLGAFVNYNLTGLALVGRLDVDRLLDRLHREDHAP